MSAAAADATPEPTIDWYVPPPVATMAMAIANKPYIAPSHDELAAQVDNLQKEVKSIDRDVHVSLARSIMKINEALGEMKRIQTAFNHSASKDIALLNSNVQALNFQLHTLIKARKQEREERIQASLAISDRGIAKKKQQRIRRQPEKYEP